MNSGKWKAELYISAPLSHNISAKCRAGTSCQLLKPDISRCLDPNNGPAMTQYTPTRTWRCCGFWAMMLEKQGLEIPIVTVNLNLPLPWDHSKFQKSPL